MRKLRYIYGRQSEVRRRDQQRPHGREEHEVERVGAEIKICVVEDTNHCSALLVPILQHPVITSTYHMRSNRGR